MGKLLPGWEVEYIDWVNNSPSFRRMKMKESTKATEVLQKGETAVVIFTRGDQFKIFDDGSRRGYTGYWKIDLRREYDKVMLYLRKDDGTNTIFTADLDDVGDKSNGRYKLFLSNIEMKAKTSSNWWDFTGNRSSNPVKCI